MLEISGLCAGYGGHEVLSGVELSVHPGEVAALLGLNGSGKSTLLRAAMGLMPVTAGRVMLWGEDMTALSARKARAVLCLCAPAQPCFRRAHCAGSGAHGRQCAPCRCWGRIPRRSMSRRRRAWRRWGQRNWRFAGWARFRKGKSSSWCLPAR